MNFTQRLNDEREAFQRQNPRFTYQIDFEHSLYNFYLYRFFITAREFYEQISMIHKTLFKVLEDKSVECKTLRQIGSDMNYSHERIRQMEVKARRIFRHDGYGFKYMEQSNSDYLVSLIEKKIELPITISDLNQIIHQEFIEHEATLKKGTEEKYRANIIIMYMYIFYGIRIKKNSHRSQFVPDIHKSFSLRRDKELFDSFITSFELINISYNYEKKYFYK